MGNVGKNERVVLEEAISSIARAPEQDKFYRAVTDIYDRSAIDDLRELVHSDFALLKTKFNSSDSIPSVESINHLNNRELSPEELKCMVNLKADFDRGIVVILDDKGIDLHKNAFEKDRRAGMEWEKDIKQRLMANDCALLKKAVKMPGGAELIGVYPDGSLCMISRNNDKYGNREPVIIAFDCSGNRLIITTDTPDREVVIKNISSGQGRFANYWEIREAVHENDYTLPIDIKDLTKVGLIASAEVVTSKPFIGNMDKEVVLECGDVSRSDCINILYFDPGQRGTLVYSGGVPCHTRARRGAVFVLIG